MGFSQHTTCNPHGALFANALDSLDIKFAVRASFARKALAVLNAMLGILPLCNPLQICSCVVVSHAVAVVDFVAVRTRQ